MSLDRSLRSANSLVRHRNVLTRAERLAKLKEEEMWDESKSVFGLVKVANRKQELIKGGGAAAGEEGAAAEGAAAGTAGAAPAAGGAAPAAAGAKGAAPAAGGKAAAPAAGAKAAPAAPAAKGKK
jgi:small basic protein (TIGR04137 family)